MGVESRSNTVSQPIKLRLHRLRNTHVILDAELARVYGIRTKQLNQRVKRHIKRFPADFAFQLTPEEWWQVRTAVPEKRGHGGRRYRPRAFTEQGMMLAGVMQGRRAAAISIELLRAFAASRDDHDPTDSIWEWGKWLLTDAERLDLLEREILGEEPGTVTYFIQSGLDGPIKIGVTTNFPARLSGLQTSSPTPLRVLGVVPRDIESECHVLLRAWRLHGEWFEPTPEVLAFIREKLHMSGSVN